MIISERDVPLRSIVLMRDDEGDTMGRELYVLDSEWNDFVSLVN